ncbi:hypothetical protein ACQP1P_33250 [Dactylosporangium sp. CA-052675]
MTGRRGVAATVVGVTGGLPFDARWLPLTGVFVLERVRTVRRGRPR